MVNALVEVAYAKREQQLILTVPLRENLTAEEAIVESGILETFPEINLLESSIGIFSKPCTLKTVLQKGDRVEIYRPLIADPKEVRKQRAAQGKSTKKGVRAENEN